MKKITLLLLFVLTIFVLASCAPNGENIVAGITDPTRHYTYDDGEKYQTGEFAQTTEEIDSISIDWLTGSVNVIGEDRAGIIVQEDYRPKEGYEPYSVHTYQKDGTLYIKFMHVNLRITTEIPNKNLTVTVPKDFDYKKISITTDTATCSVSDVICRDFAHDSGGIGADFLTENCTYKSFFSNVTTGDTVIHNCTFSEKTEFIMGTGSVVMDNSQTVLLKGQCRTGDLILQNSVITKANVNISLTGDGFITDLMTEDFSLECTTGSITAHLAPDMSDYLLDCHSPFDIVYPEDYVAPTEKTETIVRLHTTTGKVKFADKETVEQEIAKAIKK